LGACSVPIVCAYAKYLCSQLPACRPLFLNAGHLRIKVLRGVMLYITHDALHEYIHSQSRSRVTES